MYYLKATKKYYANGKKIKAEEPKAVALFGSISYLVFVMASTSQVRAF